MIKLSGGIRTKWGLVIAAGPEGLSVQVKPGEATPVERANYSAMERQAFVGSDLASAAGRLMAAHLALSQGTIKGKWDPAQASDLAWSMGTASIGRQRAAVMDWLELGLIGHAEGTSLSPTEVAWYRACHAAATNDLVTLTEQLAVLPAEGYAGRITLVQRHVTALAAEPAKAKVAAASIEGLAEADTVAAALLVVLRDGTLPERISALRTISSALAECWPEQGQKATELTESVAKGAITDPGDLPLPMTRAVSLWSIGRKGEDLDSRADHLAPLPLSMVDDLVDNGALTAASKNSTPFTGPHGPYLTARVAPGALTLEDAYHLEFTAEYARRLYNLGDLERLTQFPPGEPDSDHYIALLRLRNNPVGGFREGLRPRALEVLEEVDAYLGRVTEGTSGLPPDTVVTDPTLWRLLRPMALKGRIKLTNEERAKSPQFSAWLDLVEMQRLCFAGEWTEVRAVGIRLKDELDQEALRDEALNMVAFAEATLGRPQEALAHIEDALEGSYTEALVVNASIIAAELGSTRAASFLARIFEEAPDRTVGAEALSKGVSLWLADPSPDPLPQPIVLSMRRALQEPQQDEALKLFLRVLSDHDAAWLASATVVAEAGEQEAMVDVWRTLAAAVTPGTNTTLSDVATILVGLNKQPVVYPWAAKEFDRLIDLLFDAVHVDFGEAAWVVGPVRILAESRLLTLWQETVLMCQAGAHVASDLVENGHEIADHAESQLLFAPAERWHSEKGDLPEGLIEAGDDEVGRCLGIATLAMVRVTARHWDAFGEEWQALVARERWDSQNRYAILRLEAQALDEVGVYLERCRRYLQRLNRFPIPEKTEELRRGLAEDVDGWSREHARLRSLI